MVTMYTKPITIFFLFLVTGTAGLAQMPEQFPIYNEFGKPIPVTFPPSEHSYIPGQLIVKFREGALDYKRLCYEEELTEDTRQRLLGEHYTLEEVILDKALVEELHRMGAFAIQRLSVANPCRDTVSVTREGELIRIYDYNFMKIHFGYANSNERDILDNAITLTLKYQRSLELADLNYYLDLQIWDPNDDAWQYPVVNPAYLWNYRNLGMDEAWEHTKGRSDVKVAVVDNGINYSHRDLGSGFGPGSKIIGGWSWTFNSPDISTASWHGTPVTGIIGAFTNNIFDIPGIAGGDAATGEMGVQIAGYQVSDSQDPYSGRLDMGYAIAAILEASTCGPTPNGYGQCCNFINASWGAYQYDEMLRSAIADAFERGSIVIAARGNDAASGQPDQLRYPASYDESWIVSTGASNDLKDWAPYSNIGGGVDFIAPGGDRYRQYITSLNESGGHSSDFEGTSFAAPHATGIAALILSYALDHNGIGEMPVNEDYQGMMKASCFDLTKSSMTSLPYNAGYD